LYLLFVVNQIQLYSGGYGEAFTETILPSLDISVNTAYYITDASSNGTNELDLFSLFVLDGQQVFPSSLPHFS
jgi:hypothetical protein